MRWTIIILLILCLPGLSNAQLFTHISSEKTITSTAGDTCIIYSGNGLKEVMFTITNESATDTVQFKTENETSWHTLYPGSKYGTTYGESYTPPVRVYAKMIIRKILSGTGAFSRLWAF